MTQPNHTSANLFPFSDAVSGWAGCPEFVSSVLTLFKRYLLHELLLFSCFT